MKVETLYKVLSAVYMNNLRKALDEGKGLGVSEEVRQRLNEIVPKKLKGIKEIGKETGTSRQISQIMEVLRHKGIIIFLKNGKKHIPILTPEGESMRIEISRYIDIKKRHSMYAYLSKQDRFVIEKVETIKKYLGLYVTEDEEDKRIKQEVGK